MPREKHYLNLDAPDALDPTDHKLSALMDDYTFYSSGQKEMEEAKKAAAGAIVEHLQRAGWDGLDYGNKRYQMQTTVTRHIVKEKLLERGVSVEDILYATVESTSSPFLRGYARGKE